MSGPLDGPVNGPDVDVLIVGAGPVGLALAYELRLHDVTVLVVDGAGRVGPVRSMGLHPRTLAMLDRRGLLEDFRKAQAGEPDLARFRGGYAGIFLLGQDDPAAEQPHGLGMSREFIRTVYRHRLAVPDEPVRYHCEFVDYTETADGLIVRLDGTHGTDGTNGTGAPELIRTRYLVGCDGGGSLVRRRAGIGFPGTEASVTARLGMIRIEVDPPVEMGWRRTPSGWIAGLPFGRIMTYEWEPPPDPELPMTTAELQASIERVLGRSVTVTEHDPGTMSRFGDSARQAERYRHGRVFLAGDAAHIHLPVGGQGVNLGLQDAMNLGWKLAAACQGWAPPGLLDSYHAERHPVGAAVVQNTRAQSALMRPGPQTDALRELFGRLLTDFAAVNAMISEQITGVGLRYPAGPGDHPAVGSFPEDRPLTVAGRPTRLVELLHPAHGLLLECRAAPGLAPAAEPWSGRVRHLRVEAQDPLPAAVLLRPDGFVAWATDRPLVAGEDVEALRTALSRWFGEPPVPGTAAASSRGAAR
ncbi:FAD-dependent monooxygenase [Streptomyces sp. 1331.2]|uniref:FAD-dependent monooxygenase n=1 Tax=Streptomyces sp. 1331.2 TaxID=1938835 RepID=UPI000BCBED67|nr:FAD-dependent monooxygenase [Streptomyces sp. 1331.2]SOB86011.1 2-polyprenyl-6-methoxyphenol hydroxylase [Streptomyces sp. 1331.2]